MPSSSFFIPSTPSAQNVLSPVVTLYFSTMWLETIVLENGETGIQSEMFPDRFQRIKNNSFMVSLCSFYSKSIQSPIKQFLYLWIRRKCQNRNGCRKITGFIQWETKLPMKLKANPHWFGSQSHNFEAPWALELWFYQVTNPKYWQVSFPASSKYLFLNLFEVSTSRGGAEIKSQIGSYPTWNSMQGSILQPWDCDLS